MFNPFEFLCLIPVTHSVFLTHLFDSHTGAEDMSALFLFFLDMKSEAWYL
jgi:hypothetical protein